MLAFYFPAWSKGQLNQFWSRPRSCNTIGRTFPRVAGDGWRVAGDGWRVTGDGWRVAGGGLKIYMKNKII